MIFRYFVLIQLLFIAFFISAQTNSVNLSGKWQVILDSENELIQNYPNECITEGAIILPGSLAENGFGWKTSGSDYGILTPEFKYIGKAWYKKTDCNSTKLAK